MTNSGQQDSLIPMLSLSTVFMILGFSFACYAVVGNDSIQTLGTFLSSNRKRPWWMLWGYLGGILAFVLVYGWVVNSGDVSYGRLSRIPQPDTIQWWHLIPVGALLILTRLGIPVSTTFMVLSIFSGSLVLKKIIFKSLMGYGVAFGATFLIWIFLSWFEKKIRKEPLTQQNHPFWIVAQWASTGFLWSQWLIQDLANIFVFFPRQVPLPELIFSSVLLLGLLALIIRNQGGIIQEIVLKKTNTLDIRSATLIDFFYGLVIFYFKQLNNLPMSTTWVFLGVLAGRELITTLILKHKSRRETFFNLGGDVLKATIGLVVSVGLVFLLKPLGG